MDEHGPLYPATSIYIVKLRRDSAPNRGVWTGRVAHVASGTHADFTSAAELLAWLSAQQAAAGTGE